MIKAAMITHFGVLTHWNLPVGYLSTSVQVGGNRILKFISLIFNARASLNFLWRTLYGTSSSEDISTIMVALYFFPQAKILQSVLRRIGFNSRINPR